MDLRGGVAPEVAGGGPPPGAARSGWAADLPAAVRARRPMIHCITNLVTMEWVARGLLAAGAAPLMARHPAEAGEAAGAADALVLNLGTWDPETHAAMLAAGRVANQRGIPVVLDPVGAGGLDRRTGAAREIAAAVRLAAVRGNAGEVAALAGSGEAETRGVETVAALPGAAAAAARQLATRWDCLVACTGAMDVVTDGLRTLAVQAGHPLLARVPGTGCLATALVAAALAVAGDPPGAASRDPSGAEGRDPSGAGGRDPLAAAAGALLWLGVAGERAAAAGGPGSFAPALLDALAAAGPLPAGRVGPPLAERLRVYAIVSGETPPAVVAAAVAGGAGAVQFREKRLPLGQQVAAAERMAQICREGGALFIVNDRVDLALAVNAGGVHLGQEDLPVALARGLLGPERVIGATCETPDEARRAAAAGADYLGVGPVYATATKPDAGAPYGPDVIRRVAAATRLPVVGIGGIGPGRAAAVALAGAAGVAVSGALVQAPDPRAVARQLLEEVEQALWGGRQH